MKQSLLIGVMVLCIHETPADAADTQQGVVCNQTPPAMKDVPSYLSLPCGSSASGEDSQDVAIREARRARESAADIGDDKLRWKRSLYSDSIRPKDLEVQLVRAENFGMQLIPARRQLYFTRPGGHDGFEFEQPQGSANALCPGYAIKVVTASDSNAVVRKSCKLHEYRPGRFSMGAAYYLYDAITHTMHTIWQSQTGGKDDQFPAPNREPKVTANSNGIGVCQRSCRVTSCCAL